MSLAVNYVPRTGGRPVEWDKWVLNGLTPLQTLILWLSTVGRVHPWSYQPVIPLQT